MTNQNIRNMLVIIYLVVIFLLSLLNLKHNFINPQYFIPFLLLPSILIIIRGLKKIKTLYKNKEKQKIAEFLVRNIFQIIYITLLIFILYITQSNIIKYNLLGISYILSITILSLIIIIIWIIIGIILQNLITKKIQKYYE